MAEKLINKNTKIAVENNNYLKLELIVVTNFINMI